MVAELKVKEDVKSGETEEQPDAELFKNGKGCPVFYHRKDPNQKDAGDAPGDIERIDPCVEAVLGDGDEF